MDFAKRHGLFGVVGLMLGALAPCSMLAACAEGAGADDAPGEAAAALEAGPRPAGAEARGLGAHFYRERAAAGGREVSLLARDGREVGALRFRESEAVVSYEIDWAGQSWRVAASEGSLELARDGRVTVIPTDGHGRPNEEQARVFEQARPALELGAAVLRDVRPDAAGARGELEAASCGQWGNAGPGTPSGVCGIAASRIRAECLGSLQQANIGVCSVSCVGCVFGFCTWCSAVTDYCCQ